jgi:predicted dehydrogenase
MQHERVIFIPWAIEQQDIFNFIHACDIMIHARSAGETFGFLVFQEQLSLLAHKLGKDISLDEGNELIALANSQKKILSVFQNKRLESDHLDVQKIIESGSLGRVVEVEWHYDRYRTNITHKKWKEDNLPGSGTWFDLGIHMVDSMLCLFGKPKAVYADMRSLRRAEGSTDYFNVCFHYADLRVILRSSTYVSEKGATVSIHGDKGSFLKFGQDVQESQMVRGIIPGMTGWAQPGEDNYGVLHVHSNGESTRTIIPGQRGCYENYYNNIVDAINGNAPLVFLPQQSLLGVELLLAADESVRRQGVTLL